MRGYEFLDLLGQVDADLVEQALNAPRKKKTGRRTALRLVLAAAALTGLTAGAIAAYSAWRMPDRGETYQGENIQVHETRDYPMEQTDGESVEALTDQWFILQAKQVLDTVNKLDLDAEKLTVTRQTNQSWSRQEVQVSFTDDGGRQTEVTFDAETGYLIEATTFDREFTDGTPMAEDEALAIARQYYEQLPYARGYEYRSVEKYDDHAWSFSFDKAYTMNLWGQTQSVYSPYEEVRITIDPCTGSFQFSNCFYVPLLDDHEPGTEPVTEAQALQIAEDLDILAQPVENYEVTAALAVCLPRPGEMAEYRGTTDGAGESYRYSSVSRLGWSLRFDGQRDGFADSYWICIDLYTAQVLSIGTTG